MKNITFSVLFLILISSGWFAAGSDWMFEDFESGGKNWQLPADTPGGRIEQSGDEHGSILLLAPDKVNLAASSVPIKLGRELNLAESYELLYELKLNAVTAGKLSVSLVFFDSKNNLLKQYFIRNFETWQTTAGWQYFNTSFGKNTQVPFPENAVTMQIRFSFWSNDGKSSGEAMFDHVRIISAVAYDRINRNFVKDTDVGILEPRMEFFNDRYFYWMEAEDLVPADATLGSFKYRHAWTKKKNGLPDESGNYSLTRPFMRNAAEAAASFRVSRSGYYNLWVRLNAFKTLGTTGFTLDWDGRTFEVTPASLEQNPADGYVWVKVNPSPVKVKKTRTIKLKINNNLNPAQQVLFDSLLFTDDLSYIPPRKIPSCQYFSVLPYSGVNVHADFWLPAQLNSPLYICQDSAQHFLVRLRNLSAVPQRNFKIEITLPDGITMDNPVNASLPKDYAGAQHAFTASLPAEFEYHKISRDNKNFNQYSLHYRHEIKPYNLDDKLSSLFFLVINAEKNLNPGNYLVTVKTTGDKITGSDITQSIEVLPEPGIARPRLYEWGIDAVYSSLLNLPDQKKVMNSFERAGATVWADRINSTDQVLAARNREQWKMLIGSKNMRLVNWGDWWWPGSTPGEDSRDYIRRHPETLGAWRNDEHGRRLAGKLICPQYLIQGSGESYIREHLEKMVAQLLENGAREYIEDLECSSPESFCFCNNCKQAFAEFSGIPFQLLKDINGDRIVFLHKNKWTEFRSKQNAEIVDKITTMARQINPEITIRVFGDYPSAAAKYRYGIDWQRLLKLKNIEGIYAGGGAPATAEQLIELSNWCRAERKSMVSMVSSTLGIPSGIDELIMRNQAYLESRIIHDMMCGAGGVYIWWWGTLDGRCIKALANASRIGEEYGDILLEGKHITKKIGITAEFVLLTSIHSRGKIIALVNPSSLTEDVILEPDSILNEFPENVEYTNLISGKKETRSNIKSRIDTIFRQGDVALWFIPAQK